MSLLAVGLATTVIAYGWLSIALTLHGARNWYSLSVTIAAAATAAWAAIALIVPAYAGPAYAGDLAACLRDAAWLAVLLLVIRSGSPHQRLWRNLAFGAAILVTADLAFAALDPSFPMVGGLALESWLSRMAVAAFGLLLVENVARNASKDEFWALKLLCIALGMTFSFGLVMEIPQAFTRMPSPAFAATQPLIFLLALPLLVVTAVRMPAIALKVHSSRQAVFHSASLLGLAVVIEGMAAAAYVVRSYGGTMATALAIVLLFSAAAALLTAAASTTLRSRLRLFINENFFSYKYDYRIEWKHFIASLSTRDDDNMPLRVLRTFSEMMDCPGGALLIRRHGDRKLMPLAQWSLKEESPPLLLDEEKLAALEDDKLAYIQLDAASGGKPDRDWALHFPFGWLAVPLRYRGGLVAMVVLCRPRVARKLNWEDENLISLVAQQLAIYLVHDEACKDLDDARRLEVFTRKVAFVVHDMKSSIGQLALLAANAERFGHDEQFRKDMVETIRHSAAKLQELMQRLKDETPKSAPVEKVDLCALLADFVAVKQRLGLNVQFHQPSVTADHTEIDRSALLSVLEHVVSNAAEAANGAPVTIRLEKTGDGWRISVRDCGQGMAPTFLADELFRPLHSTKGKGFGLGAYQARQTMHDLQGELEIRSEVGAGTTVELLLPATSGTR